MWSHVKPCEAIPDHLWAPPAWLIVATWWTIHPISAWVTGQLGRFSANWSDMESDIHVIRKHCSIYLQTNLPIVWGPLLVVHPPFWPKYVMDPEIIDWFVWKYGIPTYGLSSFSLKETCGRSFISRQIKMTQDWLRLMRWFNLLILTIVLIGSIFMRKSGRQGCLISIFNHHIHQSSWRPCNDAGKSRDSSPLSVWKIN